jgi:hypothetical protein
MAKSPTTVVEQVAEPVVNDAVTLEVTGAPGAKAAQKVIMSDAPLEVVEKAPYMSPRTLAEMEAGKASLGH